MKQAILVTGGAGYIGSHTALLLAQQGYHVIILDKLLHQQTWNAPWATFVQADFADTTILDRLFTTYDIAAVMHFAAFIEVGESVRNPLAFYDNNVIKTIVLLETMVKHKVSTFIFSSSCAVYGTPTFLPLTEDHPKQPISPYGTTKLMVEMILHDFQVAYGLSYIALRYFNAVGALPEHGLGEQHQPESHVLPLLLEAARTGKPFTIFGTDHPTTDGTCVRDFLHVVDIAHAHIAALHHLQRQQPSDCFNLGTGQGTSVKELVSVVEQVTRAKINLVCSKARPGDPALLVADATRAQSILGWQPRHSQLEQCIKTAYLFSHQSLTKQAVAQV